MTDRDDDRDEVAELADRMQGMSDKAFLVEWASLTGEEREDFLALVHERVAHRKEKREALEENVRVLGLLFAYQEGAVTALEFVERVRGAMPDPLVRDR